MYTSPSAFPNPRRPRLFALEKGIEDDLEEIVCDMTPGGDRRKWQHLKTNPWGEHSRKEALSHAAFVNTHLSDGRDWLLGGDEPTFAGITLATAIAFSKFPVNNTPLDELFEDLATTTGTAGRSATASRGATPTAQGLEELEYLKSS